MRTNLNVSVTGLVLIGVGAYFGFAYWTDMQRKEAAEREFRRRELEITAQAQRDKAEADKAARIEAERQRVELEKHRAEAAEQQRLAEIERAKENERQRAYTAQRDADERERQRLARLEREQRDAAERAELARLESDRRQAAVNEAQGKLREADAEIKRITPDLAAAEKLCATTTKRIEELTDKFERVPNPPAISEQTRELGGTIVISPSNESERLKYNAQRQSIQSDIHQMQRILQNAEAKRQNAQTAFASATTRKRAAEDQLQRLGVNDAAPSVDSQKANDVRELTLKNGTALSIDKVEMVTSKYVYVRIGNERKVFMKSDVTTELAVTSDDPKTK